MSKSLLIAVPADTGIDSQTSYTTTMSADESRLGQIRRSRPVARGDILQYLRTRLLRPGQVMVCSPALLYWLMA
ncbi:unnamed protein product [Zymoseptoria tritici ST99CH_3D7]|uniref:Uncharacterized protein n=1 Tax=Zymoseptoria tritici (strain ST99CH_3D7) TaxID=1276538 RepID=A0A1X7RRZ4_ZYMT9|nr:unnamed protein product [Zymoseptoria tritici ST99CH_3D7]